MEILLRWDIQLFYFIHSECANDLFDFVLPLVRNKFIWMPVYVGIITYVLSRYDAYRASYILLMIIGSVALTDICSGQFLKKYVQRERPCANSVIKPEEILWLDVAIPTVSQVLTHVITLGWL